MAAAILAACLRCWSSQLDAAAAAATTTGSCGGSGRAQHGQALGGRGGRAACQLTVHQYHDDQARRPFQQIHLLTEITMKRRHLTINTLKTIFFL